MQELHEKLLSMRATQFHDITALKDLFVELTVRKGTSLDSSGYSYPTLYYVEEGLVMGSYIINELPYPSWIIDSGFISPGGVFSNQLPFAENIQAIEESRVYALNLNTAALILRDSPYFCQLFLEIQEESIHLAKEREILLRMTNAKDRFNVFAKNQRSVLFRVNAAILAKLLNMSKNHLFKIKKSYLLKK